MRLIFKIGFLGIVLAASFYRFLQPEFSTTAAANRPPHPLWEIDLSQFGYQGRPPIHLGPEDAWGTSTYQQGVFFTEPNVVAAFYVVHDDPSGAAPEQRKPLPSDHYRLVAVFLNAERGELIQKIDWPLPSTTQSVSTAFFIPATRGRFIVGIGNTLSLYSPAFKILAQHTAQAEIEGIASPSGETVLLGDTRKVAGQWGERFDLLETEGLSVLKSWTSLPQPNQILWGDEIARMTPQSVSIRTSDGVAKTLLEGRQWFCGGWSFINREMIAMFQCGGAEKLIVISTDGRILHQFDLGLEQGDGPVTVSRNGKRFALPTRRWGSGRNKDPEKLIARVFGLDADKPIVTLDVTPHYSSSPNFDTPQGDTRFGWGGLALSPEGDMLALKSGPVVQLFQLPEPGESAQCSRGCASDDETANPRPAVSQQERDLPAPIRTAAPSKVVEQVLSWLPADTETVMAASGPFLLPKLNLEEEPGAKEPDEIGETFEVFPLGLFGFNKGIWGKYFKDEKVLFALEGSRNFRNPTGLGEGPFQGCNVAVFEGDISERVNSFLKDSSKAVLRTERIEGQEVAVFQEKSEEDVWTTFVAFPKPNVAIAATNEEYLREVLARINGKHGERALPDRLPEWKYVDRHAAFWAVRHYDKKGASTDPTSPFARKGSGLIPDDQAIGLAFTFDPHKSMTATITYLSGDKNILPNVQKHLAPVETEPGAKEMHIRYREIVPGVVEGSYDLQHIESAETFAFVLGALLGHMVAV